MLLTRVLSAMMMTHVAERTHDIFVRRMHVNMTTSLILVVLFDTRDGNWSTAAVGGYSMVHARLAWLRQ